VIIVRLTVTDVAIAPGGQRPVHRGVDVGHRERAVAPVVGRGGNRPAGPTLIRTAGQL